MTCLNASNLVGEREREREREREWGAQQERGGDKGSCQQQRQEPTEEVIVPSLRAWCTFGRHFSLFGKGTLRRSSRTTSLMAAPLTVCCQREFLFSSLALQLGRWKGVFFCNFHTICLSRWKKGQKWPKSQIKGSCHNYRKRGSASYIVREVRSLRERERERYRERERKRERERERERRKWRHVSSAELGDEFCTFPCQNAEIGDEFCTFPCQKFPP